MTLNFSVIVINYRSAAYATQLIKKWLEQQPRRVTWEMLVVDNGSPNQAEEVAALKKLWGKLPAPDRAKIKLLASGENLGFGGGNNWAAREAQGEWLFFLNADTVTTGAVLDDLWRVIEEGDADGEGRLMGLAPELVLADGQTKQAYAAGRFPTWWSTVGRLNRWRDEGKSGRSSDKNARGGEGKRGNKNTLAAAEELKNVDWISGAAMAIERSCFEKVGGFDEHYFMYFEDMDLCQSLYQQFPQRLIAVDPRIKLIHLGGKSVRLNRERYRLYFAAQDYYWQKNYAGWEAGWLKLLREPYKWWRLK